MDERRVMKIVNGNYLQVKNKKRVEEEKIQRAINRKRNFIMTAIYGVAVLAILGLIAL